MSLLLWVITIIIKRFQLCHQQEKIFQAHALTNRNGYDHSLAGENVLTFNVHSIILTLNKHIK